MSYHEESSEIWLKPWGRVTREKTVVEGNDTVIKLEDQVIRQMTALQAHGSEDGPPAQDSATRPTNSRWISTTTAWRRRSIAEKQRLP